MHKQWRHKILDDMPVSVSVISKDSSGHGVSLSAWYRP